MKTNKKATSILEAMIVLLIMVVWITGLYDIFSKSTKLSESTKNRIEAIEISREWIEAMKNIRDTNWLMYWADIKNCFNTLNYDSSCVWWWWSKIWTWSYKIYQDKNDFKWYLNKSSWNLTWSGYRDFFRVYKDNDWFYSQSWASTKTIFTREISISYRDDNYDKMSVDSIVEWVDSSKNTPHKIEINNLIHNWKQDK